VGLLEADQSLVLGKSGTRISGIANLIYCTYHPCLGLRSRQPYSAPGGKIAMNSLAAEMLKQQIPLLDYIEAQDWRPVLGGLETGCWWNDRLPIRCPNGQFPISPHTFPT
jgi:hypothetical protein